ncbi:MAG: bile acid:sodium symporter family protein [Clostridiales bacterium]|nr:bile acid:sodium symporter family protein [Clostridiales bacterium]
MKIVEKIASLAGKYMAIIVLAMTCVSLFFSDTMSFLKTSWVNPLLMIVMLGMGLTIKMSDFAECFKKPKGVIGQTILRYTVTPCIALGLSKLFNLSTELTVGFLLVAVCPGGTASNVMTYLANGDVALSVAMTSVATIIAPVVTPMLTLLLVGEKLDVSFMSMFTSIIKVVMVPIIVGAILNKLLPKLSEKLQKIFPLISVIAITLIVGAVVSNNAANIMEAGIIIIVVVALLNICGYITGGILGKVLGYGRPQINAIAIETAMQNSGLATSLAISNFASMPMAAIPGAVFSVWHNVFGAVIANLMAKGVEKEEEKNA